MGNKAIKTGLIGFGTGGSFFHAPFIDAMPEFELTAVLERTKEKSKVKYPKAIIVRTIEELLAIPEIELIVITTPNVSHFELASKALSHGKHVLLDKPFTVASEEGEKLIELAQQVNCHLSVYHNRRFHSDFRTLQQVLENKVLGEISLFEANFDRFRPELRPTVWKEIEGPGAGILYDLGSHLIDQSLTLFGLPTSIQATLKIERPGASTIDYFEVILNYPTHKSILKSGMLVKIPGPLFKLTGKNGNYTKFGLDPQEDLLRLGVIPNTDHWAMETVENWGVVTLKDSETKIEPVYTDYRALYLTIFEAIRLNKDIAVTANQANDVIRCIELAIQSNVENNALITL